MREKGFGFLSVVILVVVLGVAAFLFVTSDSGKILTKKISSTPTPTPAISAVPTPNNEVKVHETDLPNGWKLFVNQDIPDEVYSISHPKDWTLAVSSYNRPEPLPGEGINDILKLEQNGRIITITRAPVGPGVCRYLGEPNTDNYPGWTYVDYQEFKIYGSIVRRSRIPDSIYESGGMDINKAAFNICEESKNTFGAYVIGFGEITYQTPRNISQNELLEMDSILQTLQKVK